MGFNKVSYPFGFGLFAYGSAEVKYSNAQAVRNTTGASVILAAHRGKIKIKSILLPGSGPQSAQSHRSAENGSPAGASVMAVAAHPQVQCE